MPNHKSCIIIAVFSGTKHTFAVEWTHLISLYVMKKNPTTSLKTVEYTIQNIEV
jgi:hypothetical protein